MIKEFNMKVNDRGRAYPVTVIDSNKNGIDLTGAVIVCTMKSTTDATLKINRQSTGIVIDADQVANAGQFEYQWQDGDTNTEDRYKIEFEIDPAIGEKFTVPDSDTDDPAFVNVNSSLDTT